MLFTLCFYKDVPFLSKLEYHLKHLAAAILGWLAWHPLQGTHQQTHLHMLRDQIRKWNISPITLKDMMAKGIVTIIIMLPKIAMREGAIMAAILVAVIMERLIKICFSLMTKISLRNIAASLDQELNQVLLGMRKGGAEGETTDEVPVIIEMALNTFEMNNYASQRRSGGMMTAERITISQKGKEFTRRRSNKCMAWR